MSGDNQIFEALIKHGYKLAVQCNLDLGALKALFYRKFLDLGAAGEIEYVPGVDVPALIERISKHTLATFDPRSARRPDWPWVSRMRRAAIEFHVEQMTDELDGNALFKRLLAVVDAGAAAGDYEMPLAGDVFEESLEILKHHNTVYVHQIRRMRRKARQARTRAVADAVRKLAERSPKIFIPARIETIRREIEPTLGTVPASNLRRIVMSESASQLKGVMDFEPIVVSPLEARIRQLPSLQRRVYRAISQKKSRFTVLFLDDLCQAVYKPADTKSLLSTQRSRVREALQALSQGRFGIGFEIVRRGGEDVVVVSHDRSIRWTGVPILFKPRNNELEKRAFARMSRKRRAEPLDGAEAIVQHALDTASWSRLVRGQYVGEESYDRPQRATPLTPAEKTVMTMLCMTQCYCLDDSDMLQKRRKHLGRQTHESVANELNRYEHELTGGRALINLEFGGKLEKSMSEMHLFDGLSMPDWICSKTIDEVIRDSRNGMWLRAYLERSQMGDTPEQRLNTFIALSPRPERAWRNDDGTTGFAADIQAVLDEINVHAETMPEDFSWHCVQQWITAKVETRLAEEATMSKSPRKPAGRPRKPRTGPADEILDPLHRPHTDEAIAYLAERKKVVQGILEKRKKAAREYRFRMINPAHRAAKKERKREKARLEREAKKNGTQPHAQRVGNGSVRGGSVSRTFDMAQFFESPVRDSPSYDDIPF